MLHFLWKQEEAESGRDGDIVKGKFSEKNPSEFKITGIAQEPPYGYENYWDDSGVLIIDRDYFKNYKYNMNSLYIDASNPDSLEKKIRQIEVFKQNDESYVLDNINQRERDEKAVTLIIKILAFGFIGVITLVGLTNIFNTITANVELRQNDFAILRSDRKSTRLNSSH